MFEDTVESDNKLLPAEDGSDSESDNESDEDPMACLDDEKEEEEEEEEDVHRPLKKARHD